MLSEFGEDVRYVEENSNFLLPGSRTRSIIVGGPINGGFQLFPFPTNLKQAQSKLFACFSLFFFLYSNQCIKFIICESQYCFKRQHPIINNSLHPCLLPKHVLTIYKITLILYFISTRRGAQRIKLCRDVLFANGWWLSDRPLLAKWITH